MNNKHQHLLACILAICLVPASAFAQDESIDTESDDFGSEFDDESTEMESEEVVLSLQERWDINDPSVVYSPSRRIQDIKNVPSTVYVITDRDIALHGYRTIADLLRTVPGVQTQAIESGYHAVSIRGLLDGTNANSNILWLVDNVPVNDALQKGLKLDEAWPMELIRRVEVVLGPQSGLYGANAFQGAVHIFTKRPQDIDKKGEYHLSIGDNLTFKGGAMAAYAPEGSKFKFMGYASAEYSKGSQLIGDARYQNYLMEIGQQNVNDRKNPTYGKSGITTETNSDVTRVDAGIKMNFLRGNFALNYKYKNKGIDGSDIEQFIKDDGTTYDLNTHELFTKIDYDFKLAESFSLLTQASFQLIKDKHEHYHALKENADLNIDQYLVNALIGGTWDIIASNHMSFGLGIDYSKINNKLDDTTKLKLINLEDTSIRPYLYLNDEQSFKNNMIVLNGEIRLDLPKEYGFKPDIGGRFAFTGNWSSYFSTRLSYGYGYRRVSPWYQSIDFEDTGERGYCVDTTGTNKDANTDECENNKFQIHQAELDFIITPSPNLLFQLNGFFSYFLDLKSMVLNFEGNNEEKSKDKKELKRFYGDENKNAFNGFIAGAELVYKQKIKDNYLLHGNFEFMYSNLKQSIYKSNDDKNNNDKKVSLFNDALGSLSLGFSYINQIVAADLSAFVLFGSPEMRSLYNYKNYAIAINNTDNKEYSTIAPYAIIRPTISIALPAKVGLHIHGGYAFSFKSNLMTKSPTNRFYYEKEAAPIKRYDIMFSIQYPFVTSGGENENK